MTISEKAKLLLALLDQAAFNGKDRKTINELYEWLEGMAKDEVQTPSEG
jgi:hypothetical protein